MADTIALVGSETLLGRELRDALSSGSFGADVRLIASSEEASGTLAEQGGEAALVNQLSRESFSDAAAVVLAGDAESGRRALELSDNRPVIDLTYVTEQHPRARLRAPSVEPEGFAVPSDAIHSVAHPAAIALAILLKRLAVAGTIVRSVVHIFEPASERGAAGLDELQAQTVSLLSFKPMPKKIYDAQASFSLLAAWGEEAPGTLLDIEDRIERHLTTLMGNARIAPLPSLKLIQAPVFHGYSFSIWTEWEGAPPERTRLEQDLADGGIDVHGADLEPPNNVGVAGQDGVSVGAIARDRNNPRALWVWMAADNLRISAENAMTVLQELL